jgi:hypothetical protein
MPLINPDDKITAKDIKKAEIKRIKSLDKKTLAKKQDAILEFPIPVVFNEFSEGKKAISRRDLYLKLQRLTPYLVKRLIYESYNPENAPSVRVKASQVLLDKIIPSVSSEQVNISSDDLQSLVIVKTKQLSK